MLLERLKWWDTLPSSEWQSTFVHFQDEWLGRWSDGPDRAQCATVLWELTRALCAAPAETLEQRKQLIKMLSKAIKERDILEQAGLIKPDLKGHNCSIENPVRQAIERSLGTSEKSRGFIRQQLALLRAQLHIAHAALQIVEAEDVFSIELMKQAAIQLAKAHGNTLKWIDIRSTQSSTLEDSRETRLVRLLNQLWVGFSGKSNETQASRRALLEVERGIRWLLNLSEVECESRELIIPLVGKRKCSQENKLLEHGSLAILRVKQFKSLIERDGAEVPFLIADPVPRGLLAFGDDWHQAFEHAAQWADLDAKSNAVLMYELDFHFFRLAQDNDEQFEHSRRPGVITGGSASLAAGLLSRACLKNDQVNCQACVTGTFKSPSQLGEINGVLTKVVEFSRVYADCFSNTLFLSGPTGKEGNDAIDVLNGIESFPSIHKIGSAEDAYDKISQETELVRIYAASELRRVWNQIGQFAPIWLKKSLNAGLNGEGEFTEQQLSILDELTIEQSATALHQSTVSTTQQSKQNASSKHLDELLSCYLAPNNTVPCLKVLGGPGMGKTWMGLRWNLKLVSSFWRSLSGKSKTRESKQFPVWTTAREIQRHLGQNRIVDFSNVLCDLVVGRIVDLTEEAESFRELIKRQIDSRNVILIVDSWDERTEDDRAIREKLSFWLDSNRPLVITSRHGDQLRLNDPLQFLSRESVPWVINPSESQWSTERFAERWFGDSYSRFRKHFLNIRSNRSLYDLGKVPQLASLLCWSIESGAPIPDNHIKSGTLLQDVIQRILSKYEDSIRGTDLRLGFNPKKYFRLLQKLAFGTFDGSRWEFDDDKLERDLRKGNYAENCMIVETLETIARHIKHCGLFEIEGDCFRIVHQSLAEALTAGELARQHVEVSAEQKPTDSIDQALRLGILNSKWSNTWKYSASMRKDCTRVIKLLWELFRLEPPLAEKYFSRNIRGLMQLMSAEGAWNTSDPELQPYANFCIREFVSEALKPRCNLQADLPQTIIRLLRGNYQFALQEFDKLAQQELRREAGLRYRFENVSEKSRHRFSEGKLLHGKLKISELSFLAENTSHKELISHARAYYECYPRSNLRSTIDLLDSDELLEFWDSGTWNSGVKKAVASRLLIVSDLQNEDHLDLFCGLIRNITPSYVKALCSDPSNEIGLLAEVLQSRTFLDLPRVRGNKLLECLANQFEQILAKLEPQVESYESPDPVVVGRSSPMLGDKIAKPFPAFNEEMAKLNEMVLFLKERLVEVSKLRLRLTQLRNRIAAIQGSFDKHFYDPQAGAGANTSPVGPPETMRFEEVVKTRYWSLSVKNSIRDEDVSKCLVRLVIHRWEKRLQGNWKQVRDYRKYLSDQQFSELLHCKRLGYKYNQHHLYGLEPEEERELANLERLWIARNPMPVISPLPTVCSHLAHLDQVGAFLYSLDTSQRLKAAVTGLLWLKRKGMSAQWPSGSVLYLRQTNGAQEEKLRVSWPSLKQSLDWLGVQVLPGGIFVRQVKGSLAKLTEAESMVNAPDFSTLEENDELRAFVEKFAFKQWVGFNN